MREPRDGYEWVECSTGGGYWSKVSGYKHDHKLNFFCPHCKKITGTIDNESLIENGFCKECYVMHVEDRQTPTIDIEYYKNLRKQ